MPSPIGSPLVPDCLFCRPEGCAVCDAPSPAVDIFTRQPRFPEPARDGEDWEVDEAAVQILEGLLARAKTGEITGFAFVGGTRHDSTISAWTRSMFDDPYMFLGRLDYVKMQLTNDLHAQDLERYAEEMEDEE